MIFFIDKNKIARFASVVVARVTAEEKWSVGEKAQRAILARCEAFVTQTSICILRESIYDTLT